MVKKFSQVYQFHIALAGIKPTIWRRIQVPDTYSFWDLHVAIQDAMGWTDSHLHHFEVINPKTHKPELIGIPDEWEDEVPILAGWKTPISNYFSLQNKKSLYRYDYGDDWQHDVLLEEILPKQADLQYPTCLDGKRACPPEDCGGIWGYENVLKIIKNPKHKEYKEMQEWLNRDYDPKVFDPLSVDFSNPFLRWKIAIQNAA